MAGTWFERFLGSIADRGRAWVKVTSGLPAVEQVRELALSLLSEKGEASGAARARALLERFSGLGPADRLTFYLFLAEALAPDPDRLRQAAEAYLQDPSPARAMELADRAEPSRQELLRRLNMAPSGTAALIRMREEMLGLTADEPRLLPLERDFKHLLTSWFNPGFLELRRIDWNRPAAVLEKLIAYEAVHKMEGWDDLRRRLGPDRRCFAFFHPTLTDEPLIFVEVALVNGMARAIQPLLALDGQPSVKPPDTAIFYSISNCQRGLRGISFGNFLIKQVVEDLRQENPGLIRFSTLSPVPGFRRWLEAKLAGGTQRLLRSDERMAIRNHIGGKSGIKGSFRRLLAEGDWVNRPDTAAILRAPLLRLCAEYLTANHRGKGPSDPVARFHLGNGARLEHVNWQANLGARGLQESYGIMVNYLYDPNRIEANHEGFVRHGHVAQSDEVAQLMREERNTAKTVGNLLSFTRSPRPSAARPANPNPGS